MSCRTRENPFARVMHVAAALALLAGASPCRAAGAPLPQQQPGAVGSNSSGESDPLKAFVAPLLREGAGLVEARSQMKRDDVHNSWILVVEPSSLARSSDPAMPPYELTLLPCTRLSEMERIMGATPGGNVRFQVTGRVYVFRDHNYILPSHAAVLTMPAAQSAPAASAPPSSAATSAPAPAATTRMSAQVPAAPPASHPVDDSAEAIAQSLEQATGPIARSSALPQAAASQAPQPQQQPESSPSQPTLPPPLGGLPSSATSGAQPSSAALTRMQSSSSSLQENTSIINRRGKITRDRSGGWLLVFDADATGLADPPLKLLPCMLLQSIEDYARRSGNNSPIIITGQVYLYSGQNYLLPTVYRIPHERSRITP